MKPNLLIITLLIFSIVLPSCESHEQKLDEEFEKYKEEKLLKKDSDLNNKKVIVEPKKIEPLKKVEVQNEWTVFTLDIEKRIVKNENQIKEIKSLPNSNSKSKKRVIRLEKDNEDLRKQMNEFNEETKLKWKNFKALINHDVDEISNELKLLK